MLLCDVRTGQLFFNRNIKDNHCATEYMTILDIIFKDTFQKVSDTDKAVSASRLVKSPDSHARELCSRMGGSSCSSVMKRKKIIAEFNEIPPCVKRDESKAAVRGQKAAGPAV